MDTISTDGDTKLEPAPQLPTLRLGHSGPAVAILQTALNGVLAHIDRPVPNRVAVDGVFGPLTKIAVQTVQRLEAPDTKPIPAEGEVDPATWEKTARLLMARNTGAGRFMGMPTLRTNDHGADVVTLQRALNTIGGSLPIGPPLLVDGGFGARTRGAVTAFQALGLSYAPPITADGIVGPNTWRKLGTVLTALGH